MRSRRRAIPDKAKQKASRTQKNAKPNASQPGQGEAKGEPSNNHRTKNSTSNQIQVGLGLSYIAASKRNPEATSAMSDNPSVLSDIHLERSHICISHYECLIIHLM